MGELRFLNGGERGVGHGDLQWIRVMACHMGTNGFNECNHDFSQLAKVGQSKLFTILNVTQLAWDPGE